MINMIAFNTKKYRVRDMDSSNAGRFFEMCMGAEVPLIKYILMGRNLYFATTGALSDDFMENTVTVFHREVETFA